ncbi:MULTISPECIES: hypothetical protein [Streptomyces]|uniref:hypothetical protein n=1 Tax=Streptomyces TaxID=1883 RepID=UPI0021A38414|nr:MULTISPECIES: hypothetical protein [Streptomyces]MCT2546966.1 hypothetical protein [Streptomyces atratus]MCX4852072.1 hypothetical protein [Streptomyces sp. NBC_00893]
MDGIPAALDNDPFAVFPWKKLVLVHDPADPSSSSEPADAVGPQGSADAVSEVMAWYTRELLAERRASHPDPERLEHLLARQQECVQDRARLGDADTEEASRITALYAARLKELEAAGP